MSQPMVRSYLHSTLKTFTVEIKKHSSKWDNLGNDTRYFIITGGRGSGKSFEVGRFCALLTFEKMQKILFTRYTMTSAHLSVIPEFKEKIDFLNVSRYFTINKTEVINNSTKSSVIFRGLKTSSGDQTANLKSLQGATCWVLDEAEEERDESEFDKIDLSIRQKGIHNRIIIILNPATKAHWIYKRFFEDAGVQEGFTGRKGDVTYIHSTYLDNYENLNESFIHNVEILKQTNPDKFNHIINGSWLDKADGVIFTNWEYGNFDESLPYLYGMDFGFFDPDILCKVAIDEKRKIIYCKEEIGETGLTPTQLKDKVRNIVGNKRVVADCAEPRLIDDIRRSGVRIEPVKKWSGSVLEGVKQMQDYKIVVHPESIEIGKELNNYSEKNGQPIDAFNHRIDAIRYALQGSSIVREKTKLL